MKLVLHESGGHTKLVLHQSGAQIKLVLHQSGAYNAGDTNWFPINRERTTLVTQTGSLSIWRTDHSAHQRRSKLVLHQSGAHIRLVLHQSGAHIKLDLNQSEAHNAGNANWFSIILERTSQITDDTNWFSIELERTSQVTQTGSPSISSAHHRRHKLVLHQSGANNAGGTNWFPNNLERT
ncbi:hypothetical protein RRG08_004726 [Elysia crispata]|uniref:Uncharacterized protein n=1 Tax=Elysia crispata TaxID=231223 RepID=A0AAE0YFD1_9GAST|nr:hypothetical protein RRG08_004726 [Elysia crispata]